MEENRKATVSITTKSKTMENRVIKFRALFELSEENGGGKEWRVIGVNHFAGDRGDKQITPWLQFTGLTDKNGVEIYEGDTINGYDIPTHIDECVASPVQYSNGAFRCSYHNCCIDDYDELEVIGNIHEDK